MLWLVDAEVGVVTLTLNSDAHDSFGNTLVVSNVTRSVRVMATPSVPVRTSVTAATASVGAAVAASVASSVAVGTVQAELVRSFVENP